MIKFENLKQSAVVFDEATHTYRRGDEALSGITGLIHDVLQLGVYPDANEFVLSDEIMQDSVMETFPVFSSDGNELFFCRGTFQKKISTMIRHALIASARLNNGDCELLFRSYNGFKIISRKKL